MEYKAAQTEIKEVSETGIVVFYAAIFGNKDLGNDIIEPGAFKKTIKENFKNIRHYKHHYSKLMPGVIQTLAEDDTGLLVSSKLIIGTQTGRETHEEYKAMAEVGKSMDHSIGYLTIKFREERGENDEYTRWLKEIKLMEVSTLTEWGMNPLATTVDVKHLTTLDWQQLLTNERYFKALLNCRFSDTKLEIIEQLYNHTKSLIEERSRAATVKSVEPMTLINNFKLKM